MTLLQFVAKHLGLIVAAPGGDGGQCVDLTNLYLIERLRLDPIRANAVDWGGPRQGYIWIPNTPTNAPIAGDLVVWHEYPPLSIGQYGHVAVCLSADVMHMLTCDQDWPFGAPVSLVLHEYGGVLGWLRYSP